ncbi:HTH-type transcriptional repressor GlaR [Methylobacterium crusticola]|uniref:HTH-type transcriptional repressor GlaR n=1 Tax=Methylobacterium crusticola TaxID=1697972 RepID=A0ABQ4QUK5_9HYPH|nr:GntR family transcriptional regulator [Methylobacterium crusticola]GJD48590.1 HTH-type transcriptional repressor GlaR [Methylobacterium crusticola]
MTRASDRAYAAIKDLIQRGAIPPGDLIDETETARRLGISRTPVREALLRLQTESFVEIGRGKGIRVLPLSSAALREMYQVISGLEVTAVSLIVRRGPSSGELDGLRAALSAMDAAIAAGDVGAWGEADETFHRELMRLSGNRKLHEVGCQMRDFVLRAHRVALRLQTPEYRAASTRSHSGLIAVLLGGDAEAAAQRHQHQRLRGEEALIGVVDRFQIASL